ncbi:hypothetical protein LIER_03689 [Lithospermum erythrorhizon]|uniref:DUF4216 domain-containing protein n=1 Tax=Lithospermum erythrorhizon TaxID=34254 RepID=A0AAV3NVC3_LITER
MLVHPKTGIVQIKSKGKVIQDDIFILASQAQQMFYIEYVSDDKKHLEWVVASKTFARNRLDSTNIQEDGDVDVEFLQEEEQPVPIPVQPTMELDDDNILVTMGLYDDDDDDDEVPQLFTNEDQEESDDDDDKNDKNY